jgi:hypothetical protein
MSRPILSAHVALNPIQLTVIAGLLIGIASDIVVLAAVRFSVRLISTSARLREIIIAVLVQVGALLLLAVVPFQLVTPLLAANKDSLVAKFLLSSLLFNLSTVLGVAAFLALLRPCQTLCALVSLQFRIYASNTTRHLLFGKGLGSGFPRSRIGRTVSASANCGFSNWGEARDFLA